MRFDIMITRAGVCTRKCGHGPLRNDETTTHTHLLTYAGGCSIALWVCGRSRRRRQVGKNLLINGDFSQMEGEYPVGWDIDYYWRTQGLRLLMVEDATDGACASSTVSPTTRAISSRAVR